MNKYKKVMLIYGGISSEREISIISSKGINDSLIRNNYEVVKIDADENQMEAHDISANVEKILYNKLGVAPTVHVDPVSIKDPKTNEVKKYLRDNYSNHEIITGFHDVRVVDTKKHHVILFGIDVKPNLSKSLILQSCKDIEVQLQSIFPEFEVDISISGLHNYS